MNKVKYKLWIVQLISIILINLSGILYYNSHWIYATMILLPSVILYDYASLKLYHLRELKNKEESK